MQINYANQLKYREQSLEKQARIDVQFEDINKKIDYLKKLREKLLKMNDCDKVLVKVASPFHPMCWAYHLSKLFPKNEKIKK